MEDTLPQLLALAGPHIAWSHALDAAPSCGVAAGAGLVLVATVRGSLLALDVATGALRWRAELGSAVRGRPVVLGATIIAGTAGGQLLALDSRNGATTATRLFGSAIVSDLVADAQRVVVRTHGEVIVVRAPDLAIVTRIAAPVASLATTSERPPVLIGDALALVDAIGTVRGYSLKTGTRTWDLVLGAAATMDPVALGGESAGFLFGSNYGGVRLVDPATGATRWHTAGGATPIGAAPDAAGDLLVACLDRRLLRISRTGTVRQSALLAGPARAAPLIAGPALAVPLESGRTELLDQQLARTALVEHRGEVIVPGAAAGGVFLALREQVVLRLRF